MSTGDEIAPDAGGELASPTGGDLESVALRGPRRGRAGANFGLSPPPFRVTHLLLWVTCTGAYLAATRRVYADLPLEGALAALAQVMPRGAAWAATCILGWRLWRKVPWPLEPGLWLAAAIGLWLLAEVLLASGPAAEHLQGTRAVQAALACVIFVLPALARDLARPWKWFFMFLVALFALPLVLGLLTDVQATDRGGLGRSGQLVAQSRYFLAAAALAVVVLRDLARRVRYGWLHWAGIVVAVLVVASAWLLTLVGE